MAEQSETCGSRTIAEGVEIRAGKRKESYRVTFIYNGQRKREALSIPVTPANDRYAIRLRAEVINSIDRGSFDYATYFPNSKTAILGRKPSKRYLIPSLVETYIETLRKAGSLSPSSIATYAKWSRCRLAPQFFGKYLDELTTPDLRTWVADLASQLSPKSVRNCVGLLNSVLNQAAGDGLVSSNPLAPLKLKTLIPRKRREDDKVDPFNSVEIPAILAACPSIEEKAFFQFAFATGLRTGEMIAIKWPHIDWKRGTIRVQDNVVTGEEGTVEKETKTGSEREVLLFPAALEALAMMKPQTYLADEYIFAWQGNRWRNDQQVRARWRVILKLAKVRYRNPYQTRHTFASTLLMNGEAEIVVANLLGHTTVEMVRRHYGRFIKEPAGLVMRGDYSKAFGADAPNTPQVLTKRARSQS